jgi:hypothetical protein
MLLLSTSAHAMRTIHIDARMVSPVSIPRSLDADLAAHLDALSAIKTWQRSGQTLQRKLFRVISDHLKTTQGRTDGVVIYPHLQSYTGALCQTDGSRH